MMQQCARIVVCAQGLSAREQQASCSSSNSPVSWPPRAGNQKRHTIKSASMEARAEAFHDRGAVAAAASKSDARSNGSPVRACLWDMDGTLLDIEPTSTLAMNKFLETLGGNVDWRIKKMIVGKRAKEWTRIVLAETGLTGKTTPEELEYRWETNLKALLPGLDPLPGVEKLTAHLAALGIPQAVATSSSRVGYDAKSTNHPKLFSRFSAVVTAEDVENGKPAPDPFLRAAELLGVAPADCLVFEDAVSGVQSGVAAGMRVVAVPDIRLWSAEGDLDQFWDAGATAVVESLERLDPAEWGLPQYAAGR